MSSTREIKMVITTIKYGQPGAYDDSEWEYIIGVEGMSEFDVKEYCTRILQRCSTSKEKWSTSELDPGTYFGGYYVFEKLAENHYRYYMFRPYAD